MRLSIESQNQARRSAQHSASVLSQSYLLGGRVWAAFLFCALTCVTSVGQSESKQSALGIEILKLKLEKQVRLPSNFDPAVIPAGEFSNLEARTAIPGSVEASVGVGDEARREAARRSAALAPVDSFPNAPGRMPVFYVYSLKIRNLGPRAIEAIAWDYVFINATEKTILSGHRFLSYSHIKPAKVVTVQAWQRNRPIGVVQSPATAADQSSSRILERAVIQCVLYKDETTWKNPAGPAEVCDLLRKGKPAMNRNSTGKRSKTR